MKLDEQRSYRKSSGRNSDANNPDSYSSPHHFNSNYILAKPLVHGYRVTTQMTHRYKIQNIAELIHSFVASVSFSAMLQTCRLLSNPVKLLVSPGRKVTGTLFGNKMGHISFAVQEDPRSEPVLLLELATSTFMLVKAISSGLVRITLECEMQHDAGSRRQTKLLQEPIWTMYCNGKKCGHAVSRTCEGSDWFLLRTIQTVKAGAGVIPTTKNQNRNGLEGELMYMRARFERMVENLNSETYSMNGNCAGKDQLSVNLLRKI